MTLAGDYGALLKKLKKVRSLRNVWELLRYIPCSRDERARMRTRCWTMKLAIKHLPVHPTPTPQKNLLPFPSPLSHTTPPLLSLSPGADTAEGHMVRHEVGVGAREEEEMEVEEKTL